MYFGRYRLSTPGPQIVTWLSMLYLDSLKQRNNTAPLAKEHNLTTATYTQPKRASVLILRMRNDEDQIMQ